MDQALEDLIPGIVKPYVGWVVGMDWPEADEDAIFKKVEALTNAGKGTDGVGTSGDITFAAVKACMDGVAADSFGKYWEQFTKAEPQFLPNLTKACNQAAEQLHSYGLDVEYTKYMILFSLILLAFQIAYFFAMAAPSFGTSLSLIPGACAITRMSIQQIGWTLLRNILFSTAIMGGMDAGIQGIQVLEGNRKSWDSDKTIASLEGGALTGVAFTGMATLFSRVGGSRLASAAAQDLKFGDLTGREKFASFMTNSVGGHMLQSGAANMLGSAPMLAASGQLDLEHLAKAGTSGLIGAADGHLIKPTATGPHGGPPAPGDLALAGAHPTATDAAHHPALDGPPPMDPSRILSGDYKGPPGDGGAIVPAGDHVPPGESQQVSYDGSGQPVVPHQEGGQPHQTVAYDPSHAAPDTALADAHTPTPGESGGPAGHPTQPFLTDGGTGGRPDTAPRPRLDPQEPSVVPVAPPPGDGHAPGPAAPGEGGRGSAPAPQRPDQPVAGRPDQPTAGRPDQATGGRPDQAAPLRSDQAKGAAPTARPDQGNAVPQPGRDGEQQGGDGGSARDGGGRSGGRPPDVVVVPPDGTHAGSGILHEPASTGTGPQGSRTAFAKALEDAKASGVVDRQDLGARASRRVTYVKYRDGLETVEKETVDVAQADAEEAFSLVAQALGAPAPVVIRVGERTLVTEYVRGHEPSTNNEDVAAWRSAGYLDSRPARLLGIADGASGNADRFFYNWKLVSDPTSTGQAPAERTPVGFDHSDAFLHFGEGQVNSPFAEHFVHESDPGRLQFFPNDLTPGTSRISGRGLKRCGLNSNGCRGPRGTTSSCVVSTRWPNAPGAIERLRSGRPSCRPSWHAAVI